MNPVKTTVDLSYLDRFDATQTAAEIKIGTTGVLFKGLGEKIPSRKAALYAGKPAKDYILIAVMKIKTALKSRTAPGGRGVAALALCGLCWIAGQNCRRLATLPGMKRRRHLRQS